MTIQPSQETIEALEGVKTEILANKTLTQDDIGNWAHNAAIDMCVRFLNRYIAGEGLFQIKLKNEKELES